MPLNHSLIDVLTIIISYNMVGPVFFQFSICYRKCSQSWCSKFEYKLKFTTVQDLGLDLFQCLYCDELNVPW